MGLRQARSFCRICSAHCGTLLTIDDESDQIVAIKGDKAHPTSNGYVCFKGLQAGEGHRGPRRLLRPLKRQPDGSFAEIDSEQALDEIADRMRAIVAESGPEAVAAFKGTQATLFATHMIVLDFLKALGSTQYYSTNTIDQSSKFVSFERQGGWAAGLHDLPQSEVLLFFGCNPIISHSTMPVMGPDPLRNLKRAKDRGLKLIVVDPRKTETASHADLFLQPLPGRDAAIAAAIIRTILAEGWEDKEFVETYVGADRIDQLKRAVDPWTPEVAERVAKLEAGQIRAVAALFARDNRTGAAHAATGPSMAGFSNVTQHLVDTINIVCGRFRRAGAKAVVDMQNPAMPIHAEAISPPRMFEKLPQSRIRGAGFIGYDRLTSTLAEEILTPGEGQIRALMVQGGNPAACVPDQEKIVEALKALDLLVVIDPYMSVSAQLADYVLPPTMMYERSDLPINVPGFTINTETWTQYTPAVLGEPEGSDLVQDWYPYWAVAKRLDLDMEFFGTKLELNRNVPPTTDEMLAIRLAHSQVSLEQLQAELETHPGGRIYDPPSAEVLPGRPEADGRFDVMPDDVAQELRRFGEAHGAADGAAGKSFSHLMISRRMNRIMNSIGTQLSGTLRHDPYNPAYMNPADLAGLGLNPGEPVEIESEHGRITTCVAADQTVRPGVVSMSHCWGGLPGDDSGPGANTNLLIACDKDVEPVNAMPRMSAVPINVRPVLAPAIG